MTRFSLSSFHCYFGRFGWLPARRKKWDEFRDGCPLCPGVNSREMDNGQGLYRVSEGAIFRAEISRLRIGGISSPELGGAQGLVDCPLQRLVGFFFSFKVGPGHSTASGL